MSSIKISNSYTSHNGLNGAQLGVEATNGAVKNGSATNGLTTNGSITKGSTFNGTNSKGTSSDVNGNNTYSNGHHSSLKRNLEQNNNNSEVNQPDGTDQFSYDVLKGVANYLLDQTKYRPKIALICGTGFSALAEDLVDADIIPYHTIPDFPVSTVEGHAGQMVFGKIGDVPIMCMQGRFHYFEGYSLAKCCMPIRVMKLVGITHLIATNASGGLNEAYKTGDLVVLKDHINLLGLCGQNPLIGANEPRFGPRFLPMNKAYDEPMRKHALQIVRELGIEKDVHEGTYVCTAGPTFETVAESQMLKNMGADCVGMSTVHEVITAKHCGIKVVAISFISNQCVLDHDCEDEVLHDDVLAMAKKRQPVLSEFMRRFVTRINVK